MKEHLQKGIGERQGQWRCMFLLQSMGEKKCFQLGGLECMFLRPLRERAWFLSPLQTFFIQHHNPLQHATLSLTWNLFTVLVSLDIPNKETYMSEAQSP